MPETGIGAGIKGLGAYVPERVLRHQYRPYLGSRGSLSRWLLTISGDASRCMVPMLWFGYALSGGTLFARHVL